MNLLRFLLLAFIPAVASCATVESVATAQSTYYVLRHLHTPEGEQDPDLTTQGQAAAGQLPALFAGEQPVAIYVTPYKRTQQTGAALAARYGLTPIIYDPRNTPALVARVRSGPWPVVIVGHSNTVPDIVAQLGGTRPGPLSHPDFGDVWRIGPDGATTKLRIP